jgi:hypothetical protein
MAKFTIPPNGGYTRLCLDPWAKTFIRADGSVCLCCNAPPIGKLDDHSLAEILDGPEAKKYRLGLINGSPLPHCSSCPDRKSVPTIELVEAVERYLDNDEMDVF